MRTSRDANFAGRLVARLGRDSSLIDAATGKTLRSRDIADGITAFASGFLSRGLRPGDCILISCGISSTSALAYLGAMYAGCVPVPIDERNLTTAGENILATSNSKAAWAGKHVAWDWARANQVNLIEENFFAPCNTLASFPSREDELAALMPTSGSTGAPHLVMVSHGNLIANTEAIIRSQSLGADEKAMLIMPVSYCFGASVLHTHLHQGGSIVFDSRFIFPDKVLHALNTYQCTTFAGVPTVYNILLRRSNLRSIPLPTLRRFLQAGGALSPENIAAVREIVPAPDFFVMYGQTEATARISCLPAEKLGEKLGSVGLPLDNIAVRIVNDEGRENPRGKTGEVQVSGPSVCSGYFDAPEASQRKFDRGWLKTGDLGSLDEQGYLWLEGRTSEFIKIRGVRISLAEVEAKVLAIPGVIECAAAGVQHSEAGEALALYIVKDGLQHRGARALVDKIRTGLPSHWTCTSVKLVKELPRTSNGKVARSQLEALA